MDDQPPTVTVSISRKINLGNYESADIFFSVNGIEKGTSDQEIEELLDTAEQAHLLIRKRVIERTAEIRGKANG